MDTVFLDKTGTITYGEPALAQVRPERGVSERELLQAAASAEHGSEHPLGRAIVRYAEQKNFPISESSDFRYQVGRGIVAQVQGERVAVGQPRSPSLLGVELPARVPAFHGTSVFVANGSRYFGCLSIEDEYAPARLLRSKSSKP